MKKIRKISLHNLSEKEIDKSMQSEIRGGDCPLAQCQCNATVPYETAKDAIQARLSMYGIP